MTSLEKYHPERYRISRPFSKQIVSIYRNYTRIGNAPTHECLEAVANCISNSHNDLPFDHRLTNSRTLMKEISLSMHYASFCIHGRQIFDFNEKMSEQFRKTDIDEVKVEYLAFPYDVFYLGFGKQSDLKIDDFSFVDGAYISILSEENLEIMLTTVEDDYDPSKSWTSNTAKYYYLPLSLKDRSANIAKISSKSLQKELEERKQDPLAQESSVMEFEGLIVKNRRTKTLKAELEDIDSGYSVYWEALKLVINGLCYISAYREDIESRYPDDTPASLLDNLKNCKKPKSFQRITSKLKSMGYTKINYCGQAFESLNNEDQTTGKEIQTHWRRGHWRNQPYGSGLVKRKLIWIMPVIVRKDRSESLNDLGHIYTIQDLSS